MKNNTEIKEFITLEAVPVIYKLEESNYDSTFYGAIKTAVHLLISELDQNMLNQYEKLAHLIRIESRFS